MSKKAKKTKYAITAKKKTTPNKKKKLALKKKRIVIPKRKKQKKIGIKKSVSLRKKIVKKKIIKKRIAVKKPTQKNLKKRDPRDKRADKLISKGKERKFITQDEILKEFPTIEDDITFLSALYERFNKEGIDIVESGALLDSSYESGGLLNTKLPRGKGSQFDSIQMYLKEIGKYPLISAPEEKALEEQIKRDAKIREEAVAEEQARVKAAEERIEAGEKEKAKREKEAKETEELKESEPKKYFRLIMERYKIQDPVKYAQKEEALLAKLAKL